MMSNLSQKVIQDALLVWREKNYEQNIFSILDKLENKTDSHLDSLPRTTIVENAKRKLIESVKEAGHQIH